GTCLNLQAARLAHEVGRGALTDSTPAMPGVLNADDRERDTIGPPWYPGWMLLAFDLDKTLVTDDFRLPVETADAVSAARAAGHHVTVLTGRPLIAAREYLQ